MFTCDPAVVPKAEVGVGERGQGQNLIQSVHGVRVQGTEEEPQEGPTGR